MITPATRYACHGCGARGVPLLPVDGNADVIVRKCQTCTEIDTAGHFEILNDRADEVLRLAGDSPQE